MKKIETIFVVLVLCLGLTTLFGSCSDSDGDDDPEVPTLPTGEPIANVLEGTYKGDMICSVMGSESVFEDVTLTVAAVDDAAVSVAISSFGEPPMQMQAISISRIAVSNNNGSYTLATTEFSGTTETGRAYSGTILGSFADNIISVKFNLQYGAMPMPMICTFSAPKE